jgi:hypothetical protein
VTIPAPTLAALRQTAVVFAGFPNVDSSWQQLLAATEPGIDLGRSGHRALLLRWLNSWGCRIRYPRDGEPDTFDAGVAAWWQAHGQRLPGTPLIGLADAEVTQLAGAYSALCSTPVTAGSRARTLGPTAAAKALHALRPRTVPPWDAAIAGYLYGSRDGDAFARHLRLCRRWAVSVTAAAGTEHDQVPELLGRGGVSLAKLLDEYCYVTITLAEKAARAPRPPAPPAHCHTAEADRQAR